MTATLAKDVTKLKRDLTRKYTEEERDAMYDAYFAAREAGDDAEANRMVMLMPLHPRLAKLVAEINGKEYLQKHFNITRADEVFGEGWLNEFK